MLDPKNVVSVTAGVVADPELINDRIAKLRIAVDYAGSEKGSSGASGYFDVVYYLKDGDSYSSKNAQFVHAQITSNKMKKGSQIQLIGRLVQERWQQDNQNRSKVVVIAEHIAYAANAAPKSDSTKSDSPTQSQSASIPSEF